jgi:hypothetical protein
MGEDSRIFREESCRSREEPSSLKVVKDVGTMKIEKGQKKFESSEFVETHWKISVVIEPSATLLGPGNGFCRCR